ncbi:MAG: glycerate kinase [Gemmatimonadota bacterium]|nr:glycerate kinase [Gemmatimonadota bacterium]
MSRPRIVVLAQPFKESLSSPQVAAALAAAVQSAGGDPVVVLGSDGGDGLLDALESCCVGWTSYQVADPLLRSVTVRVGWLDGGTAVVESRLSCGLGLLQPSERTPQDTSTRGVGQLIDAAVRDGATRVFVGLGGSATMDAGMGMARTWGWLPLDANGAVLDEGGGALARVARLAVGQGPAADLVGLCDVANPLTGTRGARVYAGQKGATAPGEQMLAAGLERLAACLPGGKELACRAGAGAAGGLGFGLAAFGRGSLVPGAAWVLERVGLEQALSGAALVVVGEGSFDQTSLEGKLTGVALSRTRQLGIHAVLVAPQASGVPDDVTLATGGSWWDAAELERRAARALGSALRLLGS